MTDLKVYTTENLPEGLIGLASPNGQLYLQQASVINRKMVDLFTCQKNDTNCGPASLALLMNSLNLGYHVKFQSVQRHSKEEETLMQNMHEGSVLISEDEIVNSPNAREFIQTTKLTSNGLTLSELATLSMCCGLGVNTYFAYKDLLEMSDEKKQELTEREKEGDQYIIRSVDEFRTLAKSFLKRPVTGLIVNYFMPTLKYELPFGHFSPIAAYHEESDRFLIMDVWHSSPPVWVETTSLFDSLVTIDSDSGLPRGFLHIHELL